MRPSPSTNRQLSVVMLGATGAVGGHVAGALAQRPEVARLTLLGRRPAPEIAGPHITQPLVDVLQPASYQRYLEGHAAAICTLGIGQPSKVSKVEFVRIDKQAVLDFAAGCKQAGVRHFQLLSSVGAASSSASFYLRTKGELEDGLRALRFERLSLFHPSMILTPTNRYGFSQAATLAVWPKLSPLLCGSLRRFRGVPVEQLGQAMAANVFTAGAGEELLEWDHFAAL